MLRPYFWILYLATLFLCVALWARAAIRWSHGIPLLAPRSRKPSPFGLIDILILFFFWFVGQVVAGGLIVYFLGNSGGSEMGAIITSSGIGLLFSTGLGVMVVGLRHGSWKIFGIEPTHLWEDIKIGLAAFFMVVPGVLLIQWACSKLLVEYQHPTLELLKEDGSLGVLAATWFVAVLVAPLCEELFFRGTLFPWLERMADPDQVSIQASIWGGLSGQSSCRLPPSNRWMPIVVSSIIFALVHVGQGAAPIPLFAFGLALAYLYRQTGSLFPSLVLHISLNAFSMLNVTLAILQGS